MENVQWEKADVEIVKLDPKEEFVGIYNARDKRPWTDRNSGETKEIEQFHFTRPDGTRFVYFGDAGFVNTFVTAGVQVGALIKVVKGNKVEMAGGRTVNQYDLFVAKTPKH